jgi:hypothetical protein
MKPDSCVKSNNGTRATGQHLRVSHPGKSNVPFIIESIYETGEKSMGFTISIYPSGLMKY